MSSASAWLALARWPNTVIAAVAVCAAAGWAAARIDAPVVLTAIAAAALTAVANSANDIADIAIDRVAHPHRPLPAGHITIRGAMRFAIVCAGIALVLLAFVAWALVLVTIPVLAVMLTYSQWLKRRGLPGNVAVAILASLPFLYGAWAAGAPGRGALLVFMAAPLHFAREVAKDLDDAQADATSRRTIPVVLGVNGARFSVLTAVVIFSLAVIIVGQSYPRFALLLLPTLLLSLLAVRLMHVPARPQRLLKIAMVCAIIALFASRS